MSNICVSRATVKGKGVEIMYKEMDKAFVEPLRKNERLYLEHLLDHMGLTDDGRYCIEGYVTWFEYSNDELLIDMESSWSPQLDAIVLMQMQYAPDAEVFYWATEPNEDIFWTNDPSFIGNYSIDVFDDVPEYDRAYEKYEEVFSCEPDTFVLPPKDLEFILKTSLNRDTTELSGDKEMLEDLIEDAKDWLDSISVHQWAETGIHNIVSFGMPKHFMKGEKYEV